MSITVDTGSGQSSTSPAVMPLAPAPGSFGFITDDPGLAVMKNVSNALDQPNAIRYSVSTVADVFKGSDASAVAGQRTDGLSVLVQVTETWKVTDSVTGEIRYLPISAHMVIKVPVDAEVTGARLAELVARLNGALDRGASQNMAEVLTSLIHGVTHLDEYVAA